MHVDVRPQPPSSQDVHVNEPPQKQLGLFQGHPQNIQNTRCFCAKSGSVVLGKRFGRGAIGNAEGKWRFQGVHTESNSGAGKTIQ